MILQKSLQTYLNTTLLKVLGIVCNGYVCYISSNVNYLVMAEILVVEVVVVE